MSNVEQSRPTSSRSGTPIGSTVAIIIAAVAVVLGLLVLKNLNDDDSGGVTAPKTTTPSGPVVTTPTAGTGATDTPAGGTTATPKPPTVTPKQTGTKVDVANASGKSKAAGQLLALIAQKGYEKGAAVDATEKLDTTVIVYDASVANAEAVALHLSATLCDASVEKLSGAPKVKAAKLSDGAGVLVMLGTDYALKGSISKMCSSETETTDPGTDSTTP